MKLSKCLFTIMLLYVTAVSAHDFEVEGIYYNIIDKTNRTVEVTYKGRKFNNNRKRYTGNIVIPDRVVYKGTAYSVTRIGEWAFYDCDQLTSVVIPNGVTKICRSGISSCDNLASVTIPSSLAETDYDAFYCCFKLEEVHISNLSSWCNIDFNAYSGNPLSYANNLYLNGELVTNLIIPADVTEIKYRAFHGASCIKSVKIPKNVTIIGAQAFIDCTEITNITIPRSVKSIGRGAFTFCI